MIEVRVKIYCSNCSNTEYIAYDSKNIVDKSTIINRLSEINWEVDKDENILCHVCNNDKPKYIGVNKLVELLESFWKDYPDEYRYCTPETLDNFIQYVRNK